jgi:hypothetical protein
MLPRTASEFGATEKKRMVVFVLAVAAVWVVLDVLHNSLPLIRPGSDIVYDAKFDRLARLPLFSATDRNRVMLFGNSKMLAGFRAEEFDAEMGAGTRSVNFGLPGDGRFLPLLETALSAGNVPTHVLLTFAWDDLVPKTLLDQLDDDSAIADALFPFRHMARDVATFVALHRHGLLQGYGAAAAERERMLAQRGWYFIRSQSMYADDRLPDDYRLPTDRPAQPEPRAMPPQSLARTRLEQLARQYGFKVILVPSYARRGEEAPSPVDATRRTTVSTDPVIEVAGPDYWLYPPADFADSTHLNPAGASLYTRDLVRLVKDLALLD